jgi:hypothetical protein
LNELDYRVFGKISIARSCRHFEIACNPKNEVIGNSTMSVSRRFTVKKSYGSIIHQEAIEDPD